MTQKTKVYATMSVLAIIIGTLWAVLTANAEQRYEDKLIEIDQKCGQEKREVEAKLLDVKLDRYGNCTDTEDTSACMKELQILLDKKNGAQSQQVSASDNLTKFVEAVASNEGHAPHHLSVRYNNPGAMRKPSTFTCDYERIGNKGFMVFSDRSKGIDCMKRSIMRYRDKGFTISMFANAWAPASDNNAPSTSYAPKLAAKMGDGVTIDTFLHELF